jgi:hypothetical protein
MERTRYALLGFSWSPLHRLVEGGAIGGSGGGDGGSATTPSSSEPSPSSDVRGQYSGKDSKILGTVEVAQNSVLSWTTTGENGIQSFAVMDKEFRINVSVQGKPSGQSLVKPGTYQDVTVNAVGDWTMSIDPR